MMELFKGSARDTLLGMLSLGCSLWDAVLGMLSLHRNALRGAGDAGGELPALPMAPVAKGMMQGPSPCPSCLPGAPPSLSAPAPVGTLIGMSARAAPYHACRRGGGRELGGRRSQGCPAAPGSYSRWVSPFQSMQSWGVLTRGVLTKGWKSRLSVRLPCGITQGRA